MYQTVLTIVLSHICGRRAAFSKQAWESCVLTQKFVTYTIAFNLGTPSEDWEPRATTADM